MWLLATEWVGSGLKLPYPVPPDAQEEGLDSVSSSLGVKEAEPLHLKAQGRRYRERRRFAAEQRVLAWCPWKDFGSAGSCK